MKTWGTECSGDFLCFNLPYSSSDIIFQFMRTDTKEQLEDVLENVKFSCLSWTHDNKGLDHCTHEYYYYDTIMISTQIYINTAYQNKFR